MGDFTDTPITGVKHDAGKTRPSLLPWSALQPVIDVLEFGAKKYSAGGWKKVSPERYREALLRHAMAYAEDPEGADADSGLPHLAHLACNALFLLWFREA